MHPSWEATQRIEQSESHPRPQRARRAVLLCPRKAEVLQERGSQRSRRPGCAARSPTRANTHVSTSVKRPGLRLARSCKPRVRSSDLHGTTGRAPTGASVPRGVRNQCCKEVSSSPDQPVPPGLSQRKAPRGRGTKTRRTNPGVHMQRAAGLTARPGHGEGSLPCGTGAILGLPSAALPVWVLPAGLQAQFTGVFPLVASKERTRGRKACLSTSVLDGHWAGCLSHHFP